MANNDKIRFGAVWERKTRDGETYWQGKQSDNVKILIFKVKKKNDKQPDLEIFLARNERLAGEGQGGNSQSTDTPAFVAPVDGEDEFPGDD